MRIIALTPVLLTSTTLANCFFPNGEESKLDTACNPNAIVSSCCYDNQACLSNGLCVSDPHDSEKARLHRGTCTDAAWKSGNCVRQCLDTDNNGAPVYSCNSTSVDSYCCYDDCECEDPFEVFSFDQKPVDVYTVTIILESYTQTHTSALSVVSSTPTASPSSTLVSSAASTLVFTSPTPSATAEAASGSDGGSTNRVALGVGLGIGIGVGVPAALLAAFFLWRRKKGYKPANGSPGNPSELNNEDYISSQEKYAYNHSAEVSGDSTASELPGSPNEPIELASNDDNIPTHGPTAVKYQ